MAKELRVDGPTERLSLPDAERQLVAACGMAMIAPHPPAASL